MAKPEQPRFDEAIDAFRRRVPVKREDWDKLEADERERAFMVSEVATVDVITEVWEAIDRAIEQGTSLAEFKETAGQALEEHWGGEKAGRLETIFRTNVLSNYNAGRHAIFSEPAVRRARPYLRFDAVADGRITDICAELDGTVLPADDPFWKKHTPPLHHNCRSVVTALDEDEAISEGISERPDIEPAEGFGTAPSRDGRRRDDWEPDVAAYPAPIAKLLKKRLDDAE